jgi:peptide/nickel transport system permease protein
MERIFLETFRNSDPVITKEEAREKAEALLAEAGLEGGGRLSNFPHQFSGGQLQRIGIALALAQFSAGKGENSSGGELLIADEPTTALDVTIQKQIMELLKNLQKKRGLSIIFISHNIELVADISSRIIVMYGGLVMESGPALDIITDPRHPYTKALLDASPVLGSHYSSGALQIIPGRVDMDAGAGCPFAPRCALAQADCTDSLPPLTVDGSCELRCWRE